MPGVHPLDEYPLHQAPLSMAHMATSDRNAYDRYYFNAHDRSGSVWLVAGLGVYPNLGVIDGFVALRHGDHQVTIRASDALDGHDRLAPEVGPIGIDVVEPLEEIRLTCDAGDLGLEVDLTWTGSCPAIEEQPHIWRSGPRVLLEAQRFAQLGSWEGRMSLTSGGDGASAATEWRATSDIWLGSRDRSWGIRPVGESEPPGRNADEPLEGFWWTYVPMRFDDFSIILIAQEDPDGHRTLNDATRIWHRGTERAGRIDQLGWPRYEIRYTPGTRIPTGATIHLTEPDGTPLTLDVRSHGYMPLNAGCGYGGDPTWAHGSWRGRDWTERVETDHTDPGVVAMAPFGVIDHVAGATLTRYHRDGTPAAHEGWGMFEHATFGRHSPTGFDDWDAVAP